MQIEEALAEKYLGLPTALGRSTKEAFEYMPTRVKKLVGAWSGKEVSCAGREVLLKSVAQAVPTYPRSWFLIPKDTCRKMKAVISNYWWGVQQITIFILLASGNVGSSSPDGR